MKKFTLLFLLLLTGCSFLSPIKNASNQTYLLSTVPRVPYYHHPQKIGLYVAPVTTEPLYNTTQMAYMINPHQINYFANNYWIETPSDMLKNLIIQTIGSTHYFSTVSDNMALNTNYNCRLNIHVIKLLQTFSQAHSYVDLQIRVELTDNLSGKLLGARVFTSQHYCDQLNPYGGVIAANQASAELLKQITAFTLHRCN